MSASVSSRLYRRPPREGRYSLHADDLDVRLQEPESPRLPVQPNDNVEFGTVVEDGPLARSGATGPRERPRGVRGVAPSKY